MEDILDVLGVYNWEIWCRFEEIRENFYGECYM